MLLSAALVLVEAAPAAACAVAISAPVLDRATGALRAGAVRGPGCPTAMRLVVLL
jgi:hypothetical protein